MVIRFYIQYRTSFGQGIFLRLKFTSKTGTAQEVLLTMEYTENDYWQVAVNTAELNMAGTLHYYYELHAYGERISKLDSELSLDLKKVKHKGLHVVDEWVADNPFLQLFSTRPFKKMESNKKEKAPKSKFSKHPTHIISIKALPLQQPLMLCITGSANKMNNWNDTEPVMLQEEDGNWLAKLNLSKEDFPVRYKLALYNKEQKKITVFEAGNDRVLNYQADEDAPQLQQIHANFDQQHFRGAGLNVQLSSIKTNRSWGVGDFTDLYLLADFAKACGMKLIQLLPVNDTIATHTDSDSYPYSAISAFALHPMYLNVHKMATASAVPVTKLILEEIDLLNKEPRLNYSKIVKIKTDLIAILYNKEKKFFKDDLDWFEFFELNRSWLQPYAAFCYLRDKYKTADAAKWGSFAVFNEEQIQELVSADSKAYDGIAIHYFTQYHLHLQLKEATAYAHKLGIVLKADLPIGVGRCSVDTWVAPILFNMDMQAGAPPDGFAPTGQNWSFPTYNWEEMAKDNFAWWRQRMEQLSKYFDAVRIDHVLGFFRIWSIPIHAQEGIMGHFVPAIPLGKENFINEGLHWDEARYCEPYVTPALLHQYFGHDADWIKNTFFNDFRFKKEFDTQQKLASHFKLNTEQAWASEKLFSLLANIILIKANEEGGYHFRINIFETSSFKNLGSQEQAILDRLYNSYFFDMQDDLWKAEGIKKLNVLKNASNNMLLCGEDLGMVPAMVPGVLHDLQILSLQVERMPKKNTDQFSQPNTASYDSVVTPGTHDMSSLREWWEEDRQTTQQYYNTVLGFTGDAPYYCEDWICQKIIAQHLATPAMWSVFLLQDLLAMDNTLRRQQPSDERINIPANPKHVWDYKMHISLETLLAQNNFTESVHKMVIQSGR